MIYLLPGLDGTGDLFGPLLRLLPDSTRVVSYPLDMDRWEDFVEAVVSQVDTEAPFVLFAESVSGLVAVRFLAEHGKHCKGFLACATFLTNPAPWRTAVAALPGLFRLLRKPPAWAVRLLLLSGDADAALTEQVAETIARVPPKTVVARIQLIRALRLATYAFEFPVVYVRGDADGLVAPRSEAEFAAHVRGCRLEHATGPHLLAQENPEAVARLLLEMTAAAGV